MQKPGRNDACPCGSGRKYKKCCELKRPKSSYTLLLAVGGAVLAALVIGFVQFTSERESAPAGRVWSAEHGHYH
jgi:SEC-C motif